MVEGGPVLPESTLQQAGPAPCTVCSPRVSGTAMYCHGALPAVDRKCPKGPLLAAVAYHGW